MAKIHFLESDLKHMRKPDMLTRIIAACCLPLAFPLLAITLPLLLLAIPGVWSSANCLALAFGGKPFGVFMAIERYKG